MHRREQSFRMRGLPGLERGCNRQGWYPADDGSNDSSFQQSDSNCCHREGARGDGDSAKLGDSDSRSYDLLSVKSNQILSLVMNAYHTASLMISIRMYQTDR